MIFMDKTDVTTTLPKKTISILIPVLNEEETVEEFMDVVSRMLQPLNYDVEYLFVDDGSTDRTVEILTGLRAQHPTLKVIQLSRNFGKEYAMAAGMDHASGDAVIPMDVDLQDPPEVLPLFLEKWEQGYEVVNGVRHDRRQDTFLKRITAGLFYSIINGMSRIPIPPNAGDYRLLDRKVVQVLRTLPERVRFNKGLFAWVGFRQTEVLYTRPMRHAGTSKWNYWSLWNFALDGLTGFSTLPVRVWSYIGSAIALCGFLYGLYVFYLSRNLEMVPGYASLMIGILFIGGIQLISLGVIGEYIGRIYTESKRRPLYVVRQTIGLEQDPKE